MPVTRRPEFSSTVSQTSKGSGEVVGQRVPDPVLAGDVPSSAGLFRPAPPAGAAVAGIAYRLVVGGTGGEPVAAEAQDTRGGHGDPPIGTV